MPNKSKDGIDVLIDTYIQWGWSSESMRELCSFGTITIESYEGSYVSFTHTGREATYDYFAVTCGHADRHLWECDFGIEDKRRVTCVNVNAEAPEAPIEMIAYAINKMGLAVHGERWRTWPQNAAA